MKLQWLDHVNIRTANLEPMRRFYADVLGLREGERPPFSFGGSWLYLGEQAVVHLVETSDQPDGIEPRIEHLAFRAQGLAELVATLRERDVEHRVAIVPATELRQVHLMDPDGNHVEVGFEASEPVNGLV
ncbi:MAG: VOC family protein [Gammaproteobacteria bacterium]